LEEKEEKKETSVQETLQTMLMMQMKQQFDEQNEIKMRERSNSMRRRAGSFDEQEMNTAKSQSKQGGQRKSKFSFSAVAYLYSLCLDSMSKNLLSNLSS